MIITDTEQGIHLRWRDVEGVRCENTISHDDFSPYFFVRAVDVFSPDQDNKLNEDIYLKEKWGGANSHYKLVVSYTNGDWVNLDNEELVKVTWQPKHPKYAKDVRIVLEARGMKTYEGDVQHHYRYAVDEVKEIPEQNLRRWYWDMEWQQGGKYDEAITCIVIYDNYDDEYHVFAWYPDLSEARKHVVLKDNDNFILHRYTGEHNMLTGFLAFAMDKEPDMLISWFGWKFDIPVLLTRMVHHGIDPRLLSPFDEITGIGWKKNKPTIWKSRVEGYSPVSQPIKGMITVALDLVFERQWNDAQRGTLPSLSLDYVSESVLGDVKLVSEKFPDKNEFFRRAWLEDSDTYLEYAFKDVELIKRIDE